MPRKPDPNLETTIVAAAVRLVEKAGVEGVTMREVARAAGTTTPTIYERFKDRDSLMEAVTDAFRDQLIAKLDARDSLEHMGGKFLHFCYEHPHTIELLVRRIATNLRSKSKGPVYEMVRNNLVSLSGYSPKEAEDLTLATSATIAGTALLIRHLTADAAASKELIRTSLKLLRTISRNSKQNG